MKKVLIITIVSLFLITGCKFEQPAGPKAEKLGTELPLAKITIDNQVTQLQIKEMAALGPTNPIFDKATGIWDFNPESISAIEIEVKCNDGLITVKTRNPIIEGSIKFSIDRAPQTESPKLETLPFPDLFPKGMSTELSISGWETGNWHGTFRFRSEAPTEDTWEGLSFAPPLGWRITNNENRKIAVKAEEGKVETYSSLMLDKFLSPQPPTSRKITTWGSMKGASK